MRTQKKGAEQHWHVQLPFLFFVVDAGGNAPCHRRGHCSLYAASWVFIGFLYLTRNAAARAPAAAQPLVLGGSSVSASGSDLSPCTAFATLGLVPFPPGIDLFRQRWSAATFPTGEGFYRVSPQPEPSPMASPLGKLSSGARLKRLPVGGNFLSQRPLPNPAACLKMQRGGNRQCNPFPPYVFFCLLCAGQPTPLPPALPSPRLLSLRP